MSGKELYNEWAEEVEEHPTDLGGVQFEELPSSEQMAWNKLATRISLRDFNDEVLTALHRIEERQNGTWIAVPRKAS